MTEAPPIEWEDVTVVCCHCGEPDEPTSSTFRQFKGGGPPLQCPECRSFGVAVSIKPVPPEEGHQ